MSGEPADDDPTEVLGSADRRPDPRPAVSCPVP